MSLEKIQISTPKQVGPHMSCPQCKKFGTMEYVEYSSKSFLKWKFTCKECNFAWELSL